MKDFVIREALQKEYKRELALLQASLDQDQKSEPAVQRAKASKATSGNPVPNHDDDVQERTMIFRTSDGFKKM